MVTASKVWQAPGPGLWEQDEAHQSAPFSAYMLELYRSHVNPGIEEGARRYGLLLERFDIRFIDGWAFMRPRIVGAPEKPGPLPPRWLFRLLLQLHPGLRRRVRNASRAVDTRLWRQDAEWWISEGRDRFRARLATLQAVELPQLTDGQLLVHLWEVLEAGREGLRIHFRDALAHWIGVGDWLIKAVEWTGVEPDVALAALEGASPYSVGAVEYLDNIASAASESPRAMQALAGDGDPAERLELLREASPAVATALDAYLAEHGWRVYTGFDVADKATVELPENILAAVAARVSHAPVLQRDVSPAESLYAKVPSAHRREYEGLLETARILYGVRDDDAGPCVHWTTGLVRRALLEAGERLTRKGSLLRAEQVFDATPTEVEALLGAGPVVVSASELARRAEARAVSAAARPPARLGEDEGPPPPDDWLPPAVARVNAALMVAMSIEYPAPDEAPAPQGAGLVLKGNPASRGTYEGRACLVQGPGDFANLRPGDVLVAPFTTTAYGVVLPLLGAVVTDKGGILSHAAIVAREYAIPAVVNTSSATSTIADGARVRVDGDAGTVEVLEAPGGRSTGAGGTGRLSPIPTI